MCNQSANLIRSRRHVARFPAEERSRSVAAAIEPCALPIDQPTLSVLVTGAAGFLGRDLVRTLLDSGYRVRAMVRARPLDDFTHEKLEIVSANMRDLDSLCAAVCDIDVVVHLAALTRDQPESEEINVGGARRLINACLRTGCTRIINISSQAAKIERKGVYARTKFEADRLFQASGLQVTSLLPSLVYGEGSEGAFGMMLRLVRKLPIIPVFGDGTWLSAPIHVRDVSRAIVSCIERDITMGKVYDLGGPTIISLDALLDKICSQWRIKRRKLHVPLPVALFAARAATLLPRPPITVSNVLGSNQDTGIEVETAATELGIEPLPLDAGLELLYQRSLSATQEDPPQAARADRSDEETLSKEAEAIARYLLHCAPPPELARRYVEANRVLLSAEPLSSEVKLFRRYPSFLGLLEAGSGIIRPQSLLRKKVLLMAAILEATPHYADFFLAEPRGRLRFALDLYWLIPVAVAKAVIGIPLVLLSRYVQ
jgi:nucleoside-diphosphate-sugar epimerase